VLLLPEQLPAKNVFQVHGISSSGKVLIRKQLRRAEMKKFFCNLPPCLIGMEACGGSHYWGRELKKFGHTVKLMAPQYVKPYVKTNKSDQRDAEAICEAVTRPTMRFVAIKTPEEQAILSLHTVRKGFVKTRTAQGNQIRGLLSEYGIVFPRGLKSLFNNLPETLEKHAEELPGIFLGLVERLLEELKETDRQVNELDNEINRHHRASEASLRLEKIPGIGPLTASVLAVVIGDGKEFKNGRQVAAWLGLVPKQFSTGGKTILGSISKRGDCYVRTLLIHGARSALRWTEPPPSRSAPP
jgi:transposase